jgi:hypothetical protein
MKKVIIYSTGGQPGQVIETNAGTWAELQRELTTAGVRFSGMKAVIGENRNTLESAQAILPTSGFSLFLMPIKTKSGVKNKLHMPSKKKVAKKVTKTPAKKVAKKLVKKVVAKKVTKKAVPKKAVKKLPVKKVISSLKKAVIAKTVSSIAKHTQNAVNKTVKELSDKELILNSVNTLRSIKNPNVKFKLDAVISSLEDITYEITTGKPRIDNLGNKMNLLAGEFPDVKNY